MKRVKPSASAAVAPAVSSTTPLPSDQVSAPGANRELAAETAPLPAPPPTVADTVPLPSDQISAPATTSVPAGTPVAVTETTPLPVSQPAPVAADEPVSRRAPLVHVDSTVPLPSDQLTPVAPGLTEREHFAAGLHQLGAASADGQAWTFDRAAVALSGDALDLLREDLAMSWGEVVLSPETVDALRSELGIAVPERPPFVDQEELRYFRVAFDVEHDGVPVPPNGHVRVDRAGYERLRRSTAIPASADWWDGSIDRPDA